jgi:hypothetical protein
MCGIRETEVSVAGMRGSGGGQICIPLRKQSVPPTLNDWASHLDFDRVKETALQRWQRYKRHRAVAQGIIQPVIGFSTDHCLSPGFEHGER